MKKTVRLVGEVGGKTGDITVRVRVANELIRQGLATEVRSKETSVDAPENKAEKPTRNKATKKSK